MRREDKARAKKTAATKPPLSTIVQGVVYLVTVRNGRRLVVAIAGNSPAFEIVALEMDAAATSTLDILASAGGHAHKVLGSVRELDIAIAVARRNALLWRRGRALEPCACKEIQAPKRAPL